MADDLLQGVKDALEDGNKEEMDPKAAMEQLLKNLQNMPGLSEKDRAELAESLMKEGLDAFGGGGGLPLGSTSNPYLQFLILFGLIAVICSLLGGLGYKLYKDSVNREQKRELKKLQKQEKKKKK